MAFGPWHGRPELSALTDNYGQTTNHAARRAILDRMITVTRETMPFTPPFSNLARYQYNASRIDRWPTAEDGTCGRSVLRSAASWSLSSVFIRNDPRRWRVLAPPFSDCYRKKWAAMALILRRLGSHLVAFLIAITSDFLVSDYPVDTMFAATCPP